MSTDRLRVGTVTANYNNGKYIKECLDSLVSQSRRPNIIAIIDDGSTDNSWEIILQYLQVPISYTNTVDKIINGIRFFATRQPNKGPAGARNTGLKFLFDKTDVIFVADSDDVYYKDKIKKTLDVFAKYPQVALVYTDYDTLNEKEGTKTREYKEIFNYARLFEECIVSNNSAIATSVLKIVGPYDESLRGPEDYDMW